MVSTTGGGGSKHYGSFFAETEYKNESVSFSANLLFLATKKVNFTLNGSFVHSQGSMDIIRASEVPDVVYDSISAADYNYNLINQYSDLAYSQFNISLGTEYILSDKISWVFDVEYYDLSDDKGYVYGIETGSLYVIRSGLKIGF